MIANHSAKKKFMANKATICLDDTESELVTHGADTNRDHVKSINKLENAKKDARTISDRLYSTNTCNL